MEKNELKCSCSEKSEMIVFSCSGASDLGELTDKVARKLRDNQIRNMKCITMVAIDNKPLIDSLPDANILVLDGCAVACGKKILEKTGITNFNYICLTDNGFVKGNAPASDENINKVFENVKYMC